ncbi:MAG: preprotein translocase subunit SecY [Patescibacteria group bacterium]|nr:preprotein translocase subunit SecY [Patescibacteria group bacterium]
MKKWFEKVKFFSEALKIPQVKKRVWFTAAVFLLYRFIAHLPVPGVDLSLLKQFFSQNQMLSLLDVFSGGTLANFSIAALGLGPFITASVVFQLLGMVWPKIEELMKEGEYGRAKINLYTRILTVPLAVVQGLSMYTILKSQGIIENLPLSVLVSMIIVMTTGTVVLVFLGDLISEFGLGNGTSLIIFAGIVSRYPVNVFQTASIVDSQKIFNLLIFLVLSVLLVSGIIMIEEAAMRLPIFYARRSGSSTGATRTYLPIKVNNAGVMPIIFALSLVFLPSFIGKVLVGLSNPTLAGIGGFVNNLFRPGTPVYNLTYFGVVVIFTFFYTTVVFKPDEVSEELRKGGAFIPGIRPGVSTKNRLSWYLYRVTAIGAVFLGIIAVLPSLVQQMTGISTITLGGTGVLIVISVVLEISRSVENLVQTYRYESF